MGQTVANLSAVMKEVYTSSTLKKQFYDENPLLEKIKQVEGTVIGRKATVPIHNKTNGGYTSVGAAGGSLNPAGQQGITTATYELVYHWMQCQLETGVLNQSTGGATSQVDALAFEMDGAISDMSRQISRQLVNDGSGRIAQCAATSASTVVNLQPAASGGRGAGAIVREHLRVGLPVDIGTIADSDSAGTGLYIVDVDEVAPSITLSSAVTTSTSDFVSIANPNSTTAPDPELNGLRNIAGSTTAPLGGIDPTTTGNKFWKPAVVDTTTTTWTIALGTKLQRNVFQKTGKYDVTVLTSPRQAEVFYSTLQNQVRFSGEMGMGAGNVGGMVGLSWNGQGINVMPDIYDSDWFMITLSDLIRVTGKYKDPTWVSDIEGAGGSLRWQQGTTSFTDAVCWPFQIGAERRNTHAAATALT